MILRIVLGTVLVLHGLIHLLGFAVYLRLATVEVLSCGTSLLSGKLEVGEAGAGIFGLLWLLPWRCSPCSRSGRSLYG